MRASFQRVLLPTVAFIVMMATAADPSISAQTAGVPSLPTGPAVLRVALSSSATSYSSGTPILLRTAVQNVSSKPYAHPVVAPWTGVALVIQGADGRVIQKSSPGALYEYKMARRHTFMPGESKVFGDPRTGNPWIPLANWGYALQPGTYTIGAYLLGEAQEIDPTTVNDDDEGTVVNRFFLPEDVSSNTLTITVTP